MVKLVMRLALWHRKVVWTYPIAEFDVREEVVEQRGRRQHQVTRVHEQRGGHTPLVA